jgi:hypothetical protein
MRYTVEIIEVFAGPGGSFHPCHGRASHRSPKRATEMALAEALRQDGAEFVPVHRIFRMWRCGRFIMRRVA